MKDESGFFRVGQEIPIRDEAHGTYWHISALFQRTATVMRVRYITADDAYNTVQRYAEAPRSMTIAALRRYQDAWLDAARED